MIHSTKNVLNRGLVYHSMTDQVIIVMVERYQDE